LIFYILQKIKTLIRDISLFALIKSYIRKAYFAAEINFARERKTILLAKLLYGHSIGSFLIAEYTSVNGELIYCPYWRKPNAVGGFKWKKVGTFFSLTEAERWCISNEKSYEHYSGN
jgi:hypothetical protein